jgi:hypothetical protein
VKEMVGLLCCYCPPSAENMMRRYVVMVMVQVWLWKHGENMYFLPILWQLGNAFVFAGFLGCNMFN